MLDEFLEYSEYVCSLESDLTIRLLPAIFKKNDKWNGLSRALTIIARKELEDRGYFKESTNNRMQIVAEVTAALKEWLGFCDDSQERHTEYDSWLKKYYNEKIMHADSETWSKTAKEKDTQYSKPIFCKGPFIKGSNGGGKNTALEITYEKVIADAIYRGPLKRYCLICKGGYDRDLSKKGKLMDCTKKQDKDYMESILKLICVYLIEKEYTGNEYNRLNKAELGNWAQKSEIFKGSYYRDFKYKGEDLVESRTIGKNFLKIKLNPAYLKDYDFQIVEEKHWGDIPDGYCCFSDQGAGKALKKN